MSEVTVDQAMQLALQHHLSGRLQQAEQIYRRILERVPEHARALHLLGAIACQTGSNDAAIDLIGRAIRLNPGDAEAQSNFGLALMRSDRIDEAIAAYRRAIALRPSFPQACDNLGLALVKTGQLDEAIAVFREAIRLRPTFAAAYSHLGNCLGDKGEPDEAIAALRQAISLDPNAAETHNNLGVTLRDKGELDEAIACLQKAIALRPHHAATFSNLGVALKDAGRLDEALAAFAKADDLAPGGHRVYATCFHPDYGPQQLLDEARDWAGRHAEPLTRDVGRYDNDRSPDRRLRIGYVSPNFRTHVVGRNILPVLENHTRERFEIHCFSGVKRADALTERFREISDGWHETAFLTDAGLAQLIRRERIDILVDLNLHLQGGRLMTFARKPAPVQATWAGYPGTTGLSAIDYRLTDPYLDPVDSAGDAGGEASHYSEESVRLPNSFWCFRPAAELPEVNPLPALSNGWATFGCFNNFCKVTNPALDLWARVLESVPRSRIRILSPAGSHRSAALNRFTAVGISEDRIEFVGPLPLSAYHRLYHTIDIALDPLPYTGHSTSLDAFWMGVPVVTLRGATVAARGGVSIAHNLGLQVLIAETGDDYVRIAERLAGDLPRLSALRSSLRQRMRSSPLMDERVFTRDLERAYRVMWARWCSGGK